MPLYEYYCAHCHGVFELIRPVRESSEPQPCPECSGDAKRMMPTEFNAFVFRDGNPRRLPDRGTYWSFHGEVKEAERGGDQKLEELVVPFTPNRRESLDAEQPVAASIQREVRIVKRRGEPYRPTAGAATSSTGSKAASTKRRSKPRN